MVAGEHEAVPARPGGPARAGFPEDMPVLSDQPFTLAACYHARRISVLADYDYYHAVRRLDARNITYHSRVEQRLVDAERLFAHAAELIPAGSAGTRCAPPRRAGAGEPGRRRLPAPGPGRAGAGARHGGAAGTAARHRLPAGPARHRGPAAPGRGDRGRGGRPAGGHRAGQRPGRAGERSPVTAGTRATWAHRPGGPTSPTCAPTGWRGWTPST
ncbi:hypothetical protein V2I01_40455 [Micromonospora sp. BRA006-A]|nr:hypothetical protein [Micromonospora sp. BRA006-A]